MYLCQIESGTGIGRIVHQVLIEQLRIESPPLLLLFVVTRLKCKSKRYKLERSWRMYASAAVLYGITTVSVFGVFDITYSWVTPT